MPDCPEGPTRLDREVRVGVPARRADGSGRRTAGRWVAPPAVAAVRFKRPSGRRTRLSRARLGKAVGVPRGTDDPQGPNRPGAGGFARRQPDGVLGGRPSQARAILTGPPTPGSATYQGGARPAASAVPVPAGHRSYSSGPPHLSAPLVGNLAVNRARDERLRPDRFGARVALEQPQEDLTAATRGRQRRMAAPPRRDASAARRPSGCPSGRRLVAAPRRHRARARLRRGLRSPAREEGRRHADACLGGRLPIVTSAPCSATSQSNGWHCSATASAGHSPPRAKRSSMGGTWRCMNLRDQRPVARPWLSRWWRRCCT